MKTRTLLFTLAFCLSAVVASFAEDLNVGTWKINAAKSKIGAGSPVNETVVYTAQGDSYKCVVDGKDGAGNPSHNEWVGKFDGKDYPVTGDPTAETRAVKKVDDHHYAINNKKGGKVTTTGTAAFSPDGKTRTLTFTTADAQGKKVSTTVVYDRQ